MRYSQQVLPQIGKMYGNVDSQTQHAPMQACGLLLWPHSSHCVLPTEHEWHHGSWLHCTWLYALACVRFIATWLRISKHMADCAWSCATACQISAQATIFCGTLTAILHQHQHLPMPSFVMYMQGKGQHICQSSKEMKHLMPAYARRITTMCDVSVALRKALEGKAWGQHAQAHKVCYAVTEVTAHTKPYCCAQSRLLS